MGKPKLSNQQAKRSEQSEKRLLALMKATSDVIYRMSPDGILNVGFNKRLPNPIDMTTLKNTLKITSSNK